MKQLSIVEKQNGLSEVHYLNGVYLFFDNVSNADIIEMELTGNINILFNKYEYEIIAE